MRILILILTLSGCKSINKGYIYSKGHSDQGEYIVFIRDGKRESFCRVSYYDYTYTPINQFYECGE